MSHEPIHDQFLSLGRLLPPCSPLKRRYSAESQNGVVSVDRPPPASQNYVVAMESPPSAPQNDVVGVPTPTVEVCIVACCRSGVFIIFNFLFYFKILRYFRNFFIVKKKVSWIFLLKSIWLNWFFFNIFILLIGIWIID